MSLASKNLVAPLLKVEGISVNFHGIKALDDVSFTVQSGQIVGLIGPNGAGKTTLFNCLSRLYPYTTGSIHFNGLAIDKLPRHHIAEIGIGRTFQNLALYRTMSVLDNIKVGFHCRAKSGFFSHAFSINGVRAEEQKIHEKAYELLEFLQLQDLASKRVADLPFGTQKRVELGRALSSQPQLLLLDEPACGLNQEEVEKLADLIRHIRTHFKMTVLLVEHHMGLVMGVSDQVVALHFGKKIADDSPSNIKAHPLVIEAYLGGQAA